MKNRKRIDLKTALAAALPLVLAIAGCGGDEVIVEEPVPTTVEITPGSTTLTFISATQGFSAVVRDQNGKAMPTATVSWSSSDAGIFTVTASGSNATVEAAGNGSGTLTATSGQASGTASVQVEQRAARIQIVSGDGQEGIREQVLPEPVVVRVEDQGGTAVPGVQVSFIPDPESGSVSEGQVSTDEEGMASTEWTLGIKRSQSLTASAGTAEARLSATAVSENPIPDYTISGDLMFTRMDPLDTDTIEISADITNLGDGAGPEMVSVRLSVDGRALETVQVDQVEPETTVTVTFTAGPFQAGTREVTVEIDPDEGVEEWEEANNTGSGTLMVKTQSVIGLNSPMNVSSNIVNEIQLFRVDITEASDEALNVELTGDVGDADMFVHFGDRPDYHYKYRCLSGNQASNESCQMVPTRVGSYHIAVHAFTTFGPARLEVTVGGKPVETYDIDLVFLESGTNSQNNIMTQAAERWEAVIGQGADDFSYALAPQPPGNCGPGSPATSDVVDDIRIYVTIDSIDGAGGSGGNILGRAGPCGIRQIEFQPIGIPGSGPIYQEVIRGFIELDEYDVGRMETQGVLLSVVTHELAHVLGFGTLWDLHDRLRNPSVPDKPNEDTHFEGPLTIAAFDATGGAGYAHAKVPVENSGVRGSADGHWRQSVFEDEMMTPFLTGTMQPMSAVTLESLYEIGYEINLKEAESFALSHAGAAGMALPRGPVIYLGNDIARIPIRALDPKTGRVVGVIHPPRGR